MKIGNEKITNIDRKLVSCGLMLTLVTTSLTGCTKDFQYTRDYKNESFVVEVTGTMDSKNVEDLRVVELKVSDQHLLFLARKYDIVTQKDGNRIHTYEYWDVFEDFKIISFTDEEDSDIDYKQGEVILVQEEPFENYLLCYGTKKREYTIEDLKTIFDKIEKNYEFQDDKQLVKGN